MKIIVCYTLFDITNTGVRNRSKPPEGMDIENWLKQRNTQCNFDTIQQVISLRSQPDIISMPKKIDVKFNEFQYFGFLFQQINDEKYPCWTFNFTVQHPGVFNDGLTDFGALYSDCHGVPMIACDSQWNKLPNFLDGTDELRNIYFGVKND